MNAVIKQTNCSREMKDKPPINTWNGAQHPYSSEKCKFRRWKPISAQSRRQSLRQGGVREMAQDLRALAALPEERTDFGVQHRLPCKTSVLGWSDKLRSLLGSPHMLPLLSCAVCMNPHTLHRTVSVFHVVSFFVVAILLALITLHSLITKHLGSG